MSDLQERLDRAERALTRSGFILVDGAQEWKPPLCQSASPLLDRIDLLTAALGEARDGLAWYQQTYPEAVDGSDDEAMNRIDAALAGKLPVVQEGWQVVQCEPFAWSYEWASYITTDGPQKFKAVIEREAPPQWAIDEGQARKIVPLYTATQAVNAVPEGWQLVPVEPTQVMLEAGSFPKGLTMDGYPRPHSIKDKYGAMLAAAPKPDGAT